MVRRRLLILAALASLAPGLASAQEHGQRKKGGGASYIQIDPIATTLIRPDGRRGVLTVELGVDAPDPGLRARAQQSVPRLRAAYDEVVREYASGLPPAAVPNADYLELQMQRQTDAILGRPGARVLLGSILEN